MSILFIQTIIFYTPTYLHKRTCSRVWGIAPSVALTTKIPASILAAPFELYLFILNTCNHIFNVINMPRTVHMSVMTIRCLIFNCCRIYSNSSSFFFWRFVNLSNIFLSTHILNFQQGFTLLILLLLLMLMLFCHDQYVQLYPH